MNLHIYILIFNINFMKSFEKNFKIYQIFFVVIFFLFIVNIDNSRAEWTGPSGNPPENNVMAPLNQGTTPQYKDGALHIGDNTTMGGYEFSVVNGFSYFGGDLEVGGKATIKASTGAFETDGSIILQGNIDLNDGTLDIDDGMVDINNATDDEVLSVQATKNNATAIYGSASVGNSAIAVEGISTTGIGVSGNVTSNGVGVYGWTLDASAIGVEGSNTALGGISGRFTNTVRFNPISGNTFAEINGGTIIFDDGTGIETTIEPLLINMGIGGNIILEQGDIDVEFGEIDMHINNIINVKDPSDPLDAVNLRTLTDLIDSASVGGSLYWTQTGNNISYDTVGNVETPNGFVLATCGGSTGRTCPTTPVAGQMWLDMD